MCTCSTAKRRRRKARLDKRYQPKAVYNFKGHQTSKSKSKGTK